MTHDRLDNSGNRTNEAFQSNGSSGHDPLCPYVQTAHQRDHVACQCDLIVKVRAEKLDDLHAKSFREGSEDMLAKCIEAVVDMHQDGCGLYYGLINSCDCGIESAMRALQEEP